MSLRDTGRPAQPRLAALEASSRDLRDGKVRHSATSYDQGDVPWPEGHSLRKPEGATGEGLLLTPEQAARRLSVGRTTVYALMASGELLSVNIGRCRRVPLSALRSFVTRLVDDKNTDRHQREYGGERSPFE
jgi:excisionase family DNA binding protein